MRGFALLIHVWQVLQHAVQVTGISPGGLIVDIGLVLLIFWLNLRLQRLNRRLRGLMRSSSNVDLEHMLLEYHKNVADVSAQTVEIRSMVEALQQKLPACVQNTRIVSYDAFEDIGGEQSFSVALLDGAGDGIVLSSVYSRQHVRVYAKSIKDGQPSRPLSPEEQRLLDGQS